MEEVSGNQKRMTKKSGFSIILIIICPWRQCAVKLSVLSELDVLLCTCSKSFALTCFCEIILYVSSLALTCSDDRAEVVGLRALALESS